MSPSTEYIQLELPSINGIAEQYKQIPWSISFTQEMQASKE